VRTTQQYDILLRLEKHLEEAIHAIARIERVVERLHREGHKIMATLADIQAAVAAEKTVEDSVITLLGQISQQLKDAIAANDPAAMQAVVDQIDANAKALSDAVTANTPASP
jgi:hypothetical protein